MLRRMRAFRRRRPAARALPRARGRSLRLAAWCGVVGAIAVPFTRRRLRLPPVVTAAAAVYGPVALAIATPRTRRRDVGLYALHMWAFIIVHELPNDEPERLVRRARVDYPIVCDRVIGLGTPPTVRLQRARGRPSTPTAFDYGLVWVHWLWFLEPHVASAWMLLRHPQHFPRAATMICALFDVGAAIYILVPTAPPWWAAEEGKLPGVRRIMVDVGERFWGRLWRHLYDFLGGNPVAAMPSLHFATSVMAARMLREAGPVEGALGWLYAGSLGFALVYLGEHYVIDLIAGFTLAETLRVEGPRAAPALLRASRVVKELEARAGTR